MLIDLSRTQRSLQGAMASITGRPAALLMVEFSGDDDAEVAQRVYDLQRRLAEVNGLTASVVALDPAVRDPLWDLRRAAMPLLYGVPGDRKPITFVEDCAVAPSRLPEFALRFREILKRHGTDGAFYGHASVGCLHIRPLLDLHQAADVATMRQITTEVTDLVLEFGGALSGEHGDGLARSEWNRKMFGPAIYEAFRRVKQAFDPEHLFNPGKVVDGPPMTDNLRYDPRPSIPLTTIYEYPETNTFFRSAEACNGSGVCRKTQGGTMCPSYRATRDERDSTRGRANALRQALSSSDPASDSKLRPMEQRWLYDVMSLCLECKACKTECPINVDMAKMKSEFLHAYYRRRMRPIGQVLAGHAHQLFPIAAYFAPIVNRLANNRVARYVLDTLTGIDRRRHLPTFHRDHFRKWFLSRSLHSALRTPHSALLLDDCFTTYNEPNVGQATVKVLEAAGCRVELGGFCCGRALISKGFLPQARELARRALPELSRRVASGAVILGMEPSCLLTLADDWPDLVPGPESKRVATAAHLADHWLAEQVKFGNLSLPLSPRPGKALLHGHCHQKALVGVQGSAAALRLIPGLDVEVLATGCCGMAGSFGYEREHYDVSVKIAELELLPALRLQPEALVVAPGTSCRHQVQDLAQRAALHPLEVLAGALSIVG